MTMMPPPPEGDPSTLVAPGSTNAEAQAGYVAWGNFRLFGGTVLDQAITDMYTIQGISI
jgi:hypothetical protein